MKKILLLLGLIFLTLGKIYCQDTIFSYAWTPSSNRFFDFNNRDTIDKYFYFDSTLTNNIWQLGMPSKSLFSSAYSPALALVTDTLSTYPNNNTSSFSFIVWTNCNWSGLVFWHRTNTDSLFDGTVLEYSIDGGATWDNIINSGYTLWNFYSSSDSIVSNSKKCGFTGTSDWIGSAFDGPTLSTIVEYRFTFTSDSTNTNRDGMMIDDILINNSMVGIGELEVNSSLWIFPNPTGDFITISTDNTIQFKSAVVKDILGKTILTTNQTRIDLSKFKAGIYFIETDTDKGKSVKRVIRN